MRAAAILLGAVLVRASVAAQVPDVSGIIQTAELNAAKPYFIPVHSSVTTTIRFPKEIGAPEGGRFADEATKLQPGEKMPEYLVSWQQGDPYFTVTPTDEAKMANLNVPFQNQTYVFYFYPAPDQLKAIACLNLVDRRTPTKENESGNVSKGGQADNRALQQLEVSRQANAPESQKVAATPARLIGLIDRMKLIHATKPGGGLASLVQAMNVQVAISREEIAAGEKDLQGQPVMDGVAGEIPTGMNDAALYQIILLRAVRDRRMNCVGFICLIRNTSKEVLAFDVNSFGARAGAEYLSQRISDATPILKPGEQAPAYFVVHADRNEPLSAVNDWKISVDLVSPRLNPGAAIARAFGSQEAKK